MSYSTHTLRYYEKEGLLPFINRDHTGNRSFNEDDLEWLSVICCLKNTGMPIKQIKQYIHWCLEGDHTMEDRKQMLIEHRREVLQQINELTHNLEKIDYKISHYDTCKGPVAVKQKIVVANL